MAGMKTLIIIPAFNEEESIAGVIRAVHDACSFADVLVIDDASRDATRHTAVAAGGKVISLPINLGIGGAVQTGLKYACAHNYDLAIQIDGDGQHNPAYVPALLAPILAGTADVVIGSRFIERQGYQSTFARRGGIAILRMLFLVLIGRRISDCTSGFRAYSRRTIEFLRDRYPADFPEPESILLLSRHRFRICEVPVTMHERAGGSSSIAGWSAPYYIAKVVLAVVMESMRKKA